MKKLEVHEKFLLGKLGVSNRIITVVAIVVVPTVISILAPFVMSLINNILK